MSFLRPEWLWLVAAAPVVVGAALAVRRRRSRSVVRRIGDPELVRRLGLSDRLPGGAWGVVLLLAAGLLLGLAAAGPSWGERTVEGRSSVRNVVLALDVSKSMLARDVQPDRLERERLFARRLLREMQGDRFGLVAFAGRAYVLAPLTVDHGALQLYLDALDPEIVSYGGSALSAAIRQATDLVRGDRPNSGGRAVVLVTDGDALEPEGAVIEAAERAADLGVVVHVVGVGTPEGALVPRLDPRTGQVSGYAVDEGGNRVVSRLNERLLQEIAGATGGRMVRLDEAGATERLIRSLEGIDRVRGTTGLRTEQRDRSAVALALALAALAAEALLRRSGRGRAETADVLGNG